MTDEFFKKEHSKFRNSCRVYHMEKKRLEEMERLYPELKRMEFAEGSFKVDLTGDFGKGNLELYQLLKDDVKYVEEVLDLIDKRCGHNAKVLIWALYVDNRIQVDVAEEFGLTRRQIQYSTRKCLKEVFSEMAKQ